MANPVRVAVIGCGGMGRHHIKNMLAMRDTTEIAVLCEPSPMQLERTAKLFTLAGVPLPPNQPDLTRLLREVPIDAAFIVTPHVFHFEQAVACLEAGVDVLLEKPMVMNGEEANRLIEVRDRTGKLLVVAFPGSLSPQVRHAVKLLRSGELGKLLSIEGVAWQDWGPNTVGQWRQEPEVSGGGFLFDTGAHMLNTIVDLAGEDFVQVGAWLDQNQRPVETLGVVIGRLASGGFVSLHACGEAVPSCSSEVRVFCTEGMLRTGIWGERLLMQKRGENDFTEVSVPPSRGVWEQFLAVREGTLENPCPPEVGLRMNRLYDAICQSAAQGGAPVSC